MDYDERKWINRRVFYYKDILFNSGGELSIDISTSTEDGISFSIPKLSFRIRNLDNRTRSFGLDLNETTSVICSLVEANIQNEEFVCSAGKEIIKRGYKSSLVLQPYIASTGENVVIMKIVHNESDQGKTVLQFQSFKCICNLLNMFKSDFWKIYTDLQNDYKFSSISEGIISLKNSIHILPSLISDQAPEVTKEITDSINNDFDQFLDQTNIDIPEIKKEQEKVVDSAEVKPVVQEVESKFIGKVLKGDIRNFSSIMAASYSSDKWATESFINSIETEMGLDDYLPGLLDNDRKSLSLLSKVAFKSTFKNYLENGKPIDSNFTILRYDVESTKEENVELAYDLFMLMAYIQNLRERLESKISDAQTNYSILYAAIRCYLDPLIFTFIVDKNPDVVKNCIITRYNYFLSKGFFKPFDDEIIEASCNKITASDISLLIDKVCSIIRKTKDISELHKDSFKIGVIAIPYENEFTEEQIIKEIVDLQVDKKLGLEILTSDNNLKKLFLKKESKAKVDKPVVKAQKSKPKYKSNIHRFINEVDFIKQIPKKYKGDFLVYIENLEDNYDFLNPEFPIEVFGEDIVKGLYLWNDSDNKKEAYTNFRVKHENCLSKDNIIAKVKSEIKSNDGDFNFDFLQFNATEVMK